MQTGIRGAAEEIVTEKNTAASVGSGLLPVYATPAMIALIENAACSCIAPYLEEGQGSVGTSLNIEHVSSTPVGMKVRAEVELTEIDRRRLVFKAQVFDEAGLIGKGTHERFLIDNEKFMKKTQAKR